MLYLVMRLCTAMSIIAGKEYRGGELRKISYYYGLIYRVSQIGNIELLMSFVIKHFMPMCILTEYDERVNTQ
ncbi:hypothetical protein B9T39_01930 [Alloscardovia macacae]|uniref:Uncharacterized protein n=1 Tax=Alloscardovia macacae TaxID=1160091 RepID=A0A1Y2SZJ3_9BIFI|nr:hypothetical protein B9T39_01930 [Alloscardovia macacae]